MLFSGFRKCHTNIQKKENPVIIFSPSCHSKPKIIFINMLNPKYMFFFLWTKTFLLNVFFYCAHLWSSLHYYLNLYMHTKQLLTKTYKSWSFIAYNIFNIISFIRERLNKTRRVLSECDMKYNLTELSQKRNPKCFIFTQANLTYNCNLFSTYSRIIDNLLLKDTLYSVTCTFRLINLGLCAIRLAPIPTPL